MVGPENGNSIIGVPEHTNIGAQTFQMRLCMLWIIIDEHGRLHEGDYIDFDTSIRDGLEHPIKSVPFIVNQIRPSEQKIGCNHPTSDTNLLLSIHQLSVEILIVTTAIIVHFRTTVIPLLGIAVKSVMLIMLCFITRVHQCGA